MTEQELKKQVGIWDSYPNEKGLTSSHFETIWKRLDWFGNSEWAQFSPAQNTKHSPRYMSRLAQWVGNTKNPAHQKILLEYALKITFFSHSDYLALFQNAFSGAITQWTIKQVGLKLIDTDFQAKLQTETLKRNWYCPLTDSMDINGFYHINHIVGIQYRPTLSVFKILDPISKRKKDEPSSLELSLREFMENPAPRLKAPALQRLVILEDFVGSGTQSVPALKWVLGTFSCPILFIPLIICPKGLERVSQLAEQFPGKFEVRPVLCIKSSDLLGVNRPGWPDANAIEALSVSLHDQLDFNDGPFGFENGGCSIVNFSNTPNNTLSLVHDTPKKGPWKPLFPRSPRI